MKDFPVFVPFRDEHLAAVVTVPDDRDPRSMVVLVTGTGAPRSHRFQMWTKVSRRLAEAGIASVRLDYLGIGDSSGRVPIRRMTELELRVEEVRAVAEFAKDVLGVSEIGAVGNCSGGLVTLGAASAMRECVATMCILPRVLLPNAANRAVIGLRRTGLASFIRSHPALYRSLRALRGRKGKSQGTVEGWFSEMLRHGDLLFVYSEQDTDAYNEQSRRRIERMLSNLPRPVRSRFEMRVLGVGPLSGFESLQIQQETIDTVVDWMVERLAAGPAGRTARKPKNVSVAS